MMMPPHSSGRLALRRANMKKLEGVEDANNKPFVIAREGPCWGPDLGGAQATSHLCLDEHHVAEEHSA
jgi:hypothetical protein